MPSKKKNSILKTQFHFNFIAVGWRTGCPSPFPQLFTESSQSGRGSGEFNYTGRWRASDFGFQSHRQWRLRARHQTPWYCHATGTYCLEYLEISFAYFLFSYLKWGIVLFVTCNRWPRRLRSALESIWSATTKRRKLAALQSNWLDGGPLRYFNLRKT